MTPPTPPALTWLYSLTADCLNSVYTAHVPRGIRAAIPIVGGTVTGPRINGKVLNLGADWGLTDPRTGIFSADTRYNVETDDGAFLFLQTSGADVPGGGSHLRVVIETGDPRYYWLNSVVAVGVLKLVNTTEVGYTLTIDVWNVSFLVVFLVLFFGC
jgi:hypothetical protein